MRPRVGFLGTGWIGRHRMEAMIGGGAIESAAVCDPSDECAAEAMLSAPKTTRTPTLSAMLSMGLDAVAIATPSAIHAEQAIQALNAGHAVFCQKPLGRTESEARAVVDAARAADRLLCVDLSYRHTAAMQAIAPLLERSELGRIYAADLVFHNAYRPDKAWFRDPAQAGGGCVIDLGVHLVDLALWALGWPEVMEVTSQLFAGGERLRDPAAVVEDYAVATLTLAGGAVVRLACSWNLHAGQDAVIGAEFYGTGGGAGFRNENGSFFDFSAWRYRGTAREVLASPPDDWGGRAAVSWARRLAAGEGFDQEAERLVTLAGVLDRIYGR